MKRRLLLSGLIGLAATPFAPRAAEVSAKSASRRLHLQDCRIADSHYYDCYAVLNHLQSGDPLQLRRQPQNRYDQRAIEVFWKEHKLGYLPRLDNAAAASLLDRGHVLCAEIIGIDNPGEEREPVRLRVWIG